MVVTYNKIGKLRILQKAYFNKIKEGWFMKRVNLLLAMFLVISGIGNVAVSAEVEKGNKDFLISGFETMKQINSWPIRNVDIASTTAELSKLHATEGLFSCKVTFATATNSGDIMIRPGIIYKVSSLHRDWTKKAIAFDVYNPQKSNVTVGSKENFILSMVFTDADGSKSHLSRKLVTGENKIIISAKEIAAYANVGWYKESGSIPGVDISQISSFSFYLTSPVPVVSEGDAQPNGPVLYFDNVRLIDFTEPRAKIFPARLRGINADNLNRINEDFFKKMVEWNVNGVRVLVVADKEWRSKKGKKKQIRIPEDPLVAYKKSLAHLKKVVAWSKEYNIPVILAVGGVRDLWDDGQAGVEARHILVKLWEYLAATYRDNENVIGYDLVNEPHPRDANIWSSQLMPLLVKEIRKIDRKTWLIIEPVVWGRARGFKTLKPISDTRTIYSFHMYAPFLYVMQGVYKYPRGLVYPGMLRNFNSSPKLYWDKAQLRENMKPVRDFQLRNNLSRIYVGEFSVVRWAPGRAKWLKDVVDLFEEYGWDWTYHSYGGWNGWNPTFDAEDKQSGEQDGGKMTKRLKILLKAWRLNRPHSTTK